MTNPVHNHPLQPVFGICISRTDTCPRQPTSGSWLTPIPFIAEFFSTLQWLVPVGGHGLSGWVARGEPVPCNPRYCKITRHLSAVCAKCKRVTGWRSWDKMAGCRVEGHCDTGTQKANEMAFFTTCGDRVSSLKSEMKGLQAGRRLGGSIDTPLKGVSMRHAGETSQKMNCEMEGTLNRAQKMWQQMVVRGENLGQHGPWEVSKQWMRGQPQPVFMLRDSRNGQVRTVFTAAEVKAILSKEP